MDDALRLAKRDGETDLQWHKRLIYGKLVDKTLSDYDYTELAKYVYGKDYSTDVARRCMYGSKMTLDLLEKENILNVKDESVLSEIDVKRRELQMERKRYQDQRRELNKLISVEGRAEHLYSTLADAASNLTDTIGNMYRDVTRDEFGYQENDAVLVFSDWHYGMITDNIFNKFNIHICKDRIRQTVIKADERIRRHQCSNLHIIVLGDLFHGAIHTSARVAAEELVCDQLMQVSEILAQSIDTLSSSVKNTYVYLTYGNHGRTVQNKNDNIHRDNIERIVGWWLKERLKGNESIHITDEFKHEFIFVPVRGHWFCATHGDIDRIKSSPKTLSALFRKQYGIDIDYILLGDKHHIESFNEIGVTAMLCGSLCGADEYANNKRLYSTPSQLLLIVNEKCGVDAEYRISC